VRSPLVTTANDPSVAADGEVQRSSLQVLKKTLSSDNSRSRIRRSVEQGEDKKTKNVNQIDVFKQNQNDSEDDERILQRGYSTSKQ
jgi:hypothetical protein